MFIEGYIDREFLRIITEAGFDVVWQCETQDDVRKHGYEDTADEGGVDLTKETIARIFIDEDTEELLMPMLKTLLWGYGVDKELRKKLLPLMAVSTNKRIRDYAARELEAT